MFQLFCQRFFPDNSKFLVCMVKMPLLYTPLPLFSLHPPPTLQTLCPTFLATLKNCLWQLGESGGGGRVSEALPSLSFCPDLHHGCFPLCPPLLTKPPSLLIQLPAIPHSPLFFFSAFLYIASNSDIQKENKNKKYSL